MFKYKNLFKRVMEELAGDTGSGDAGGGGNADFDMAAASAAISEGLFGKTEGSDDAGDEDKGSPGDGGEPQAKPAPADDSSVPTPGADKKPTDPTQPAADDPNAAPPVPKNEAPKTWRPDAAAEWEKLPPRVQEEVLKREADIFKGIEAMKPDATIGKAFGTALAPYINHLTATGQDAVALTKELVGAHITLSSGTAQQKQQAIQRIFQVYGLQMPSSAPADDPDNAPYVDPATRDLQKRLEAVQSQMSEMTAAQRREVEAQQAQIRQRVEAEVAAFAADPKNIHYSKVENEIAALISSGAAKDLRDAYDKAIWLNPEVRAAEQARIATEQAEAARKAALEKAEAARKASAANVRPSAKAASGTAPLSNLDDTLRETYREITSR